MAYLSKGVGGSQGGIKKLIFYKIELLLKISKLILLLNGAAQCEA
jgi:hypothetical protein